MFTHTNPGTRSATAQAPYAKLLPHYGRIKTVTDCFGLSRAMLYRLLGEQQIRAVKHGKSTLIDMESVRSCAASLPTATFRTKVSN